MFVGVPTPPPTRAVNHRDEVGGMGVNLMSMG